MTSCNDMKLDQVYVCGDCGLELKVVNECKDCGTNPSSSTCCTECSFECCGVPMKLKG